MQKYIICFLAAISFAFGGSIASAQSAEQLKMYNDYQKSNGVADASSDKYKSKQIVQTDMVKSRTGDTVRALTIYELDSVEIEKLKVKRLRDKNSVFGREIFDRKNITFAPSLNIPTPQSYILGAGDQVFIDIWGDTQRNFDLKISPDGNIVIPQVGLVQLSGLTISQAQSLLSQKFEESVEGLGSGSASIKIALGSLRSIKVNVIGEASVPGTYTLPSLASLFNALYSAGGVSEIGSLRNIKLIRNGKTVAVLDVYDYLLRGDNKSDIRLENNDLIVIEPYTSLVTLTGNVKRERVYEMKDGETMAQLIAYAGGFDGDAYTENVNLSRPDGKQFEMITLPKAKFETFPVHNRDIVSVGKVSDKYSNLVKIAGAVWREGNYAISENIQTVGDLIAAADGVKEDAYLGRAQLIRVLPDLTREVIAINVAKLMDKTAPDVMLQKNDSLSIISIDGMRQERTISIRGEVNDTIGIIPYIGNMTIEDAIITAGGLKESASRARLEVYRRIKNPNSTEVSDRKVEAFSFTIPENLELVERVSNFTLEPFDDVIIRRSPGYSAQSPVYVNGEVLFGGEYAMTTVNETIASLIKRSGGLTHEAYARGASLKRKLTQDDIERMRTLAKMVKNSVRDTVVVDNIVVGSYDNVGINLEDALNNPSGYNNIVLKEGDILTVPTYNNTVTISGAVYYPNTTTFVPDQRLKDYIAKGGGYTKAARKKPFVIYMNGTVATNNPPIEPGCQIVVPTKPAKNGSSLGDIIGISTSVISTMAMLTTLFK